MALYALKRTQIISNEEITELYEFLRKKFHDHDPSREYLDDVMTW